MRAYLTLSVGQRPQEARPLFSSDDPALVGAVLRELLSRVSLGALLEASGECISERSGEEPMEANDDRGS